jgi:hypothetical protein
VSVPPVNWCLHESDGEAPDEEEISACLSDSDEEEKPGLFDHLPHGGIPFEVSGADPEDVPHGAITTLEVVVIMLDWMNSNKCTDTSSKDMWKRLKLFLPSHVDASTFNHAKGLVQKHQAMHIQRIEMCQNDCIAYWDCKNIPERKDYRHSHRTACPKCSAPRYIKDHAGRELPTTVVYFTPIAGFLQSLYKRADLVPFLDSNSDAHPLGHTTRSRGWVQKVPHLRHKRRHLA